MIKIIVQTTEEWKGALLNIKCCLLFCFNRKGAKSAGCCELSVFSGFRETSSYTWM